MPETDKLIGKHGPQNSLQLRGQVYCPTWHSTASQATFDSNKLGMACVQDYGLVVVGHAYMPLQAS